MENDLIGGQQSAPPNSELPNVDSFDGPVNETKNYADGSSATGPAPLPDVSPEGAPAVDPPAVPVGTEPQSQTLPVAVQIPPEPEEEPDTVNVPVESLYAQEKLAHDLTKLELAAALQKLKNAAEMGFSGANIHRGA